MYLNNYYGIFRFLLKVYELHFLTFENMGTNQSEVNTLKHSLEVHGGIVFVLFMVLVQDLCYCLISYRAGAWHFRIFPVFVRSPVSKWHTVTRSMFLSNKYLLILNRRIQIIKQRKAAVLLKCPKTKSIWRQERTYSNIRATSQV